MLPEAAVTIRRLLGVCEGQTILNVGSSTPEFYQRRQPYIWAEVMAPLVQRGNTLINVDEKPGADVLASANALPFEGVADVVLCCNLLEHVPDPAPVLRSCIRALKVGGRLIMEGPADYPFHPDPIDTMLRPKTAGAWDRLLDTVGDRMQREYAAFLLRQANREHSSMVVSYRLRSSAAFAQTPISFRQQWHPGWPDQVWLWLDWQDLPIGHLVLSKKRAREGTSPRVLGGIGSLAIEQPYRGYGLGALLLREAQAQMRDLWRTDYSILWCRDPLVKWYTSLGWVRTQGDQHENLMTMPAAAGSLTLQDDLW